LADNGLEAGIEPASLDATDHATRANGYDASILIDLCKAILAAKAGGNRAWPRNKNRLTP
jgi:hypothetical protein